MEPDDFGDNGDWKTIVLIGMIPIVLSLPAMGALVIVSEMI